MSLEPPTLAQFSIWMAETLEKTTLEDLSSDYVRAAHLGGRNITIENILASSDDRSGKIKRLTELFYQFYLDCSVLTINLDYQSDRHFWKLDRKSVV
jgi:hypothetical protein